MGCDIHVCLEKRNHEGKWENIDLFKRNPYYGKYPNEPEWSRVDVYSGRDYTLFSLLCGVRSSYGDKKPISEPKGLPSDVSKDTELEAKEWGSDGHSHNWNTLQELYEYNDKDDGIIRASGLISKRQAEELDQEGKTPNAWCGATAHGSTNPDLVYREWEYEHKILANLIEKIEKQIKRTEYIYDPREHASNIRIVYWFDN